MTKRNDTLRRPQRRSQEAERAAKAYRLMLALEQEAMNLMFVGAHKLDPHSPQGSEALSAWANEMMPAHAWERLAERAGVEPPSTRTINVVRSLLKTKAESLEVSHG